MNKKIAVVIAIISIFTGTFFIYFGLKTMNGQAMINMHSEDVSADTHTYKRYLKMIDGLRGVNAVQSLTLPVVNGNYPFNPSPKEFNIYLAMCIVSPQFFTIDEYNRLMPEIKQGRHSY